VISRTDKVFVELEDCIRLGRVVLVLTTDRKAVDDLRCRWADGPDPVYRVHEYTSTRVHEYSRDVCANVRREPGSL